MNDRRTLGRLGGFAAGGGVVGLWLAHLEGYADHLSGGLLPWSARIDLGILSLVAGGLLGLAVGLGCGFSTSVARCGAAAVGVVVTVVAYSALWILGFESFSLRLLFLVGLPVYFWLSCRLMASPVSPKSPKSPKGPKSQNNSRAPRGGLAGPMLAVIAMVLGTLAVDLALADSRLQDGLTFFCMLVLPPLLVALHRALLSRSPEGASRLKSGALAAGLGLLIATPALVLSQPGHFDPLRRDRPSSGSHSGATEELPSILVVSLDTTRADHLSIYGYGRDTTPNLARLATESLVFSNFISTSTWTLPSHASVFTGLYPRTHGAVLSGARRVAVERAIDPRVEESRAALAHPLAAHHSTLPELLSARGYSTGAIVANHSYLYRYFGLAQGFDYYDDVPGLALRRKPRVSRMVEWIWPDFLRDQYRTAGEVTNEAARWLDALDDQPFFLFVNFMEPHAPLATARDSFLLPPWKPSEQGEARAHGEAEYTSERDGWTPRQREAYAAMYDDALERMDREMGRLISEAERRAGDHGLMIVVFGDHGELLGEHGEVGHIGRTPYQGLVRAPLLIKYPGGVPKGVWEGPVQSLDLFPTLLAAAEIEPVDPVQGQALPDVSHEIVVEQFIHADLAQKDPEQFEREARALYRGRYKLIATSRDEIALYDLEADPLERIDISAERPQLLETLRSALGEWESSVPFYSRRDEEQPPEHVLERLRSLGYIE